MHFERYVEEARGLLRIASRALRSKQVALGERPCPRRAGLRRLWLRRGFFTRVSSDVRQFNWLILFEFTTFGLDRFSD